MDWLLGLIITLAAIGVAFWIGYEAGQLYGTCEQIATPICLNCADSPSAQQIITMCSPLPN